MKAVTIVAKNYLHFATSLAKSFTDNHPDDQFFILVVDASPGDSIVIEGSSATILTPDDLDLGRDEFLRMALMYDVTELSTALKPWAIEALLDRDAEVVTYLDPDIFVYSPMAKVDKAALTHGIVLTPHGTSPIPRDGKLPSEASIMQSGIYNLGFIAVSRERRDFLAWWKERLLRDSISAPEMMLFTDQRWIDLIPGYWDVHILRDEGYNVAYWNVDQRALTVDQGRILANGQPLVFYHFSGFDPRKPWLLSKHAMPNPRVLLSDVPLLANMCRDYAAKLCSYGLPTTEDVYRFGLLGSGERISPTLRRVYRTRVVQEDALAERLLPIPFTGHDVELIDILARPLEVQPLVNEFSLHVWHNRIDLQIAFPDPLGRDAKGFHQWTLTSGIREGVLRGNELVDRKKINNRQRTKQSQKVGANIHGYLKAELGMGELARLLVSAFADAGIPYSAVVSYQHGNRNNAEFDETNSSTQYPVDVIVVNADQFALWKSTDFSSSQPARRRVGVWAWEVQDFPSAYNQAFDLVDEVWTISSFAQRAIQKNTSKPVYVLPLPHKRVEDINATPTEAGSILGSRPPYFLVMFDYLSVIERKNPFAAIDAFKAAFIGRQNVTLVIKTINGAQRIADRERLKASIATDSRIYLIEDYLTERELKSLMSGALAYVSLHRAEGYGLTCSEAMSLGVPVVATGYSGNLDYMSAQNSILIGFDLVPVGEGISEYPSNTVWAEPRIAEAAEIMKRLFDDEIYRDSVASAGRESIWTSSANTDAGRFIMSRIQELSQKKDKLAEDDSKLRKLRRDLMRQLENRLKAVTPGQVIQSIPLKYRERLRRFLS